MRRPPQPSVLRNSPSLFRTSIDHDTIGRRRPEGGVVPSLPDEDGRTTAPLERELQASARSQRPQDFRLGLGQSSIQVARLLPGICGRRERGPIFSLVADRKYLLGAVRANAYFGCFGFARSAFLGTSAVFP